MADDSSGQDTLTRRDTIKYGGAAAVGGLLAGCASGGGSSGDSSTSADSGGTSTESGGATDSDDSTEAGGEQSYTVEMAPAGTVEFDAVPERWETYFPGYAEMGIALGQADGLTAVGNKGRFHTQHLDELDGVSVDKSGVVELIGDSGIDKELYFELDNDLHLTDPEWLTNNDFFGLDDGDTEELAQSVGPFFGNTIFRRTDQWHDYRYYTMYEAFERVAAVFRERERYEAFKQVHDDVIADLQSKLPPADDRPNAFLGFAATEEPEEFSPYRLTDKGTNKKHLHDLGMADALAGTGTAGLSESNRAKLDYELLLDVDPDVLLIRGHEDKTAAEFEETVVSYMREHPTASELTAVDEGDVYRGGPIYLGPIGHLFIVERLATTLFPDVLSGELFDRQRVADIIGGEF